MSIKRKVINKTKKVKEEHGKEIKKAAIYVGIGVGAFKIGKVYGYLAHANDLFDKCIKEANK